MKLLLLFLMGVAAYSTALPYYNNRNVVTVPPNCPDGQVWVAGQCRDIWRLGNFYDNKYHQQALELHGQYSPILRSLELLALDRRLTQIPDLQCPEGSRPDALGNCRPRLPPPEQS